MLDLNDFRALVNAVEYKPGWTFKVYRTAAQGIYLSIDVTMENSYAPGETTDLRIKSPIPPCQRDLDFLRWLRWRLERIEVHECHEWLRWANGHSPVWDPHADWADEPDTRHY